MADKKSACATWYRSVTGLGCRGRTVIINTVIINTVIINTVIIELIC
jgi:hypothetical protein